MRAKPARLLRSLCLVTYCVEELDSSVAAWTEYLGYQLVDTDPISEALAASWGTPAAAGKPAALLQPASGEPIFLRFIATGETRGFESPATAGWTATELLVQDPDALAARLETSPFQRLAGPGDLFPGPKSPRAMQVVGPTGELIYFTRILPGGSRYGMKQARCPVDRPFIVTVSGTSTSAMQAFYAETLGMRVMPPMNFINGILAHACGVSPTTNFPTSISTSPGRRYLIEMDECPPGLPERPRQAGQLPPGMAMVSSRVRSLAPLVPSLRAEPMAVSQAPYGGRRTGVVVGAAGEWLEVLEGPAD
jgi:hypothetical protein